MIIIPFFLPTHSEPPKCPKCGRDEARIEVCVHCGHKYKTEPLSAKEIVITIFIICGSLFLLASLIIWVSNNLLGDSYFEKKEMGLLGVMGDVLNFIVRLIRNLV